MPDVFTSITQAVGAPKPTPVVVTPAEYGSAVTRTRKLDNRTFAPVDPYLARLVADAMNRTVDALVQAAVIADTTAVLVGGGATVNDVIGTDVLTASELRKAVTRLRTNKAVPWFGNYYAALVHPHVILDLREATGAVAENVIVEPSVVIGPQVDKLRRFHTVGWYGDLGFKVYEEKAIQRLVSGSSMA